MRTYIELVADNLLHNLSLFHTLSRRKIMFVIKANAYGHGLKEILEITRNCPEIGYYAVDSLSEARAVRSAGIQKPVLVIGWLDTKELRELVDTDFETLVPSLDHARLLNSIAKKKSKPVYVHLKLETGTHRLGMEPEHVLRWFQECQFPYLKIKGLYSHFANIEDTADSTFARMQLQRYLQVLDQLQGKQFLRHFSCSASVLLFPETYFDLIRVGISAYGYWPSKQTYISYLEKKIRPLELKRVLNWYSHVAQVKSVEKGASIGYGLTYKTRSRSKLAVIPIGYYDGLDRRLSNIGHMILGHETIPIRGRICMNMLMADVSHISRVRPGDRVIVIGEGGDEKVDAALLAEWTGTISYEVLTRINPFLPRCVL